MRRKSRVGSGCVNISAIERKYVANANIIIFYTEFVLAGGGTGGADDFNRIDGIGFDAMFLNKNDT